MYTSPTTIGLYLIKLRQVRVIQKIQSELNQRVVWSTNLLSKIGILESNWCLRAYRSRDYFVVCGMLAVDFFPLLMFMCLFLIVLTVVIITAKSVSEWIGTIFNQSRVAKDANLVRFHAEKLNIELHIENWKSRNELNCMFNLQEGPIGFKRKLNLF